MIEQKPVRRFRFGGTNKQFGSWDVYMRNTMDNRGFIGKAQKAKTSTGGICWFGYGVDAARQPVELGPFPSRVRAAEALLAARA